MVSYQLCLSQYNHNELKIITLLFEYRPRRQCVLWCCVVLYCAKANIPGLQPRESRVAAGWSVFSVLSPLRSPVTSPNMVTLSHCHSPESGLTFYPRATIVFSWTDGQYSRLAFFTLRTDSLSQLIRVSISNHLTSKTYQDV